MNKPTILSEFSNIIYSKYISSCTLKTYYSIAEVFIYNKHPDSINNLTTKYLKGYLLKIREVKSISSYNQYLSVLKILYRDVLKQKYKIANVKPIKQNRKLKNIPDTKYVIQTIKNISNLKHKAFVLTLYSTGMRMSELLNIRLSDVESNKHRILIRNGKGNKSRFVSLPEELLNELKRYYRIYRPKEYLFEGNPHYKYSSSSVNKVIKKHFGDEFHAHLFRHLYITYMVNKDVNIKRLKNMTGHKSDTSLEWYYQYSDNSIENEINPMHECECIN